MRASVSDAVIHRAARVVLSALAVTTIVLLVAGAAGALRSDDLSGDGGALSDGDRRALAASPALRGADPAPPDPEVDLTDPQAVARAYLAAAHSVLPGDAGHTQLRAAAYAQPGSPAASVGVVVLDPPPSGELRSADVTSLEPAGVDGNRRGYRAALHTATGPVTGPRTVALTRSLVVLARQPDGRWLVVAEISDGDGASAPPAGED
jgi:hypothetical protein